MRFEGLVSAWTITPIMEPGTPNCKDYAPKCKTAAGGTAMPETLGRSAPRYRFNKMRRTTPPEQRQSLSRAPCERARMTEENSMHGTKQPLEEARERAYATPLKDLDPSHPVLFRTDTFWRYFDRLRQEDPVHFV